MEKTKKTSIWVKIYIFLYKLFARHWWVHWSNFRFRNCVRHNINLQDEDRVKNLTEIKDLIKKLYRKFNYTKDGFDQLGDAITPPPQNYQYYLEGQVKDDCDGFHSLVYHCLTNSGIKCYLLSVIALHSGHCVLLFKHKNKWRVNDYTTLTDGFDTPQEAVDNYNKIFVDRYNVKSEVIANDIISYNYEKGKFKLESIDKVGV